MGKQRYNCAVQGSGISLTVFSSYRPSPSSSSYDYGKVCSEAACIHSAQALVKF